jgi:hypothetical protein
VAGSPASDIGRRTSKLVSQVRQRNSYSGIGASVGIWLTEVMSVRAMASTGTDQVTDTETDRVPQTGQPTCAHIVKVEPGETATAKILEARVMGTPIEALCGFVWVPSRDPKQLPICEECKSIYEMYRALNGDLRDTPGD